jgi:hypothetical protein
MRTRAPVAPSRPKPGDHGSRVAVSRLTWRRGKVESLIPDVVSKHFNAGYIDRKGRAVPEASMQGADWLRRVEIGES